MAPRFSCIKRWLQKRPPEDLGTLHTFLPEFGGGRRPDFTLRFFQGSGQSPDSISSVPPFKRSMPQPTSGPIAGHSRSLQQVPEVPQVQIQGRPPQMHVLGGPQPPPPSWQSQAVA